MTISRDHDQLLRINDQSLAIILILTLQTMHEFPTIFSFWKGVGNTIFPHDFISFPLEIQCIIMTFQF